MRHLRPDPARRDRVVRGKGTGPPAQDRARRSTGGLRLLPAARQGTNERAARLCRGQQRTDRLRPRRDGAQGQGRTRARLRPVRPRSVGARFFYLCVGHFAEGDEPYWFGRVKVPLSGIGWAAVVAASKDTDTRLQARYAATRPDGRPALATVALLDEGWAVFDD